MHSEGHKSSDVWTVWTILNTNKLYKPCSFFQVLISGWNWNSTTSGIVQTWSFQPLKTASWHTMPNGIVCCWIFLSCRARHLDRSQRAHHGRLRASSPRSSRSRFLCHGQIGMNQWNLQRFLQRFRWSHPVPIKPHALTRNELVLAVLKQLSRSHFAWWEQHGSEMNEFWLLSTMWSTQSWSGAWITSKCADERMCERNWRQPNVLCFRGWRLLSWQRCGKRLCWDTDGNGQHDPTTLATTMPIDQRHIGNEHRNWFTRAWKRVAGTWMTLDKCLEDWTLASFDKLCLAELPFEMWLTDF